MRAWRIAHEPGHGERVNPRLARLIDRTEAVVLRFHSAAGIAEDRTEPGREVGIGGKPRLPHRLLRRDERELAEAVGE